jgi:hypothetical protein
VKSEDLCQEYVDWKHVECLEQGQVNTAKVLQIKARKKQQIGCWNVFWILTKGKYSMGGISHVIIPNQDPTLLPTIIQDKDSLDNESLQCNITPSTPQYYTP